MFKVESHRDATTIQVNQDLDLANAGDLWKAISLAASSSRAPVVVSLLGCNFCDSTGLGIFIRADNRLSGRFALVIAPDGLCRRTFTITGLIKTLPIFDTIESAKRSFVTGAPEDYVILQTADFDAGNLMPEKS